MGETHLFVEIFDPSLKFVESLGAGGLPMLIDTC
jgi:hypothetical protein